jgi:hypothetical protein
MTQLESDIDRYTAYIEFITAALIRCSLDEEAKLIRRRKLHENILSALQELQILLSS